MVGWLDNQQTNTQTLFALVAQWIEHPPPKRAIMVRVRAGVQKQMIETRG